MALFDFLKRRQKSAKKENEIVLAMPVFNDGNRYDLEKVTNFLKANHEREITDVEGDNDAAAFKINGQTVALAFIPGQIPWGDIEGAAQYAYNWPQATAELKSHTGHAFVTVMDGGKTAVEKFGILSSVLYAILQTSDAMAVYQGAQSLLIPRQQYIDGMESLQEGEIPVNLWVYIGLRKTPSGNCAYTYGLKDFHNQEVEVVDSKLNLGDLYEFLINITSYVLINDITLNPGETIETSIKQKIAISSSKGIFVEGNSIKLDI